MNTRGTRAAWRRPGRSLAALVVACAALAGSASAAHADAKAIGFEPPTYAPGSIQGQGGWSGQNPPGIAINPSLDQAVTAALAHTGLQSFRESSFVTSGSFGDQVFSPSLTDRAGEVSSVADGMAGGTLQQRFTATLWFKSTSNLAQDSHVVISPDRGDGARMSWVQVSDNTALPGDGRQGLSVSFYDYVAGVLPDPFTFHVVAKNLSRSDWHRIDLEMNFYEGPENDIVKVSVDGGPQTVGTSWEDYFRIEEGNPTRPVDSLLFRVGGGAEGLAGSGFYFDDVAYASSACQPATRYVKTTGDDTYNDCSVPGAPCATVQHAVDVACSGDTVDVGPGTFQEQVNVQKSLVIDGAGKTQTKILAPAALPCSGSVVTVQGATNTVEIKELEVSGPGPNTCGCLGIRAGIEVKASAVGNVHDNKVSLIRSSDQAGLGGCQHGIGILFGGSGGFATGTIANNEVATYQKTGIVVSGAGSSVAVTGNTVDGGGGTPLIARNGIQVSFGATASVTSNTSSGNECDHPVCGPDPVTDTQSAGLILFQQAPTTTISDNDVTGNDMGIYTYMPGPGTLQVTNNSLTGNRYEGVFIDEGAANLTGNTVSGSPYGVIAVSYGGAGGNSTGTLSCNRILSNGIGVSLIDDNTGDGTIPSITAHNNQIAGNGTGASNTTAALMNFESNFWGSGTGPNPPGSGDPISGPIDAVPFLNGLPVCISCSTNADCQNGLLCDGAEVCNAGTCQAGTPVTCGAPTFCQTAVSCQEPSGSCVATPKPDGILCSDGQSCTVGDTCQAGVCQPGPGGDADGDGDCNNAEVSCGCNPNDASEVCALPNRLVGLPGSGAGEVLLNWYAPTVRKVTVATDDSCKTSGVGLCVTGRCQAGKIADLCTTDADCYEAPNTCRVVVNYGDVPDNKLYFARFGRTDVPGFVTGTPSPTSPIAVAAGCSKKVDVLVPSRRSNNLKLKAKGTVDTRPRTDIDALKYVR